MLFEIFRQGIGTCIPCDARITIIVYWSVLIKLALEKPLTNCDAFPDDKFWLSPLFTNRKINIGTDMEKNHLIRHTKHEKRKDLVHNITYRTPPRLIKAKKSPCYLLRYVNKHSFLLPQDYGLSLIPKTRPTSPFSLRKSQLSM